MSEVALTTSKRQIAVAYMRTASRSQVGSRLKLARQWRICEDHARDLGVKISRIYADVGVSGLAEHRPALDQLMHDLGRGYISHVIVADLTTLARDWQLEERILERIRSHGARVPMRVCIYDRSWASNQLTEGRARNVTNRARST